MDANLVLPSNNEIAVAIRTARSLIRWKPDKALQHLSKRIDRGHLAPDTTLEQYETIIQDVLFDSAARVYVFCYRTSFYPTIVADDDGQTWLVMFGMDGLMETAFPPDDVQEYVYDDPKYVYIGYMKDFV